MQNEDQNLIDCAQTLREATKWKTDVTVSRRATFSPHSGKISTDYNIYFGDVIGRKEWKWECATEATLQGAFEDALAKITAQGDQRARDLDTLKEAAAKLGLQLVEATA